MLTADIDASGVLAASGGNFGLAVAYAAQRLGHPAEIFVPSTSPEMKIERIRSYGATVHVVDGFYAEAFAACEERAFDTGAAFLHPYDQPRSSRDKGRWRRSSEQRTALDNRDRRGRRRRIDRRDRRVVRERRPGDRRRAGAVPDAHGSARRGQTRGRRGRRRRRRCAGRGSRRHDRLAIASGTSSG
jgi:hypothetical protein